MKRYILFFMALFCLGLLQGNLPAEAHKLTVFAYLEGKTLTGQAYFSGGKAAQHIPVRATWGDNVAGEGTTDKEGKFSFSLSEVPDQDILVVADAGLGHRAVRILKTYPPAEKNTPTLETSVSSETVREVVREELAPIKEILLSLEKEEDRPHMTQIIGGVGYIFGLVGIYLWLRQGRRPNG